MVWQMWSRDKVDNSNLKKLKKVTESEEPKKPLTAFNIFQQKMKTELIRNGMNIFNKDLQFKVSERWSNLDMGEKQLFVNQAEEERNYLKEMEMKNNACEL